jgi:hypothetical protein
MSLLRSGALCEWPDERREEWEDRDERPKILDIVDMPDTREIRDAEASRPKVRTRSVKRSAPIEAITFCNFACSLGS